MALAGVAASGAAAAAAAKEIFDYNRENFMEDREQRMKKEFAERRYRIKQAGLWREDVRGFVELTERKMSIYLLVNMLMLGFTFNLWCEGRLPEQETPVWLLMGNQIATVGAFSFLLVTVWLAMHASVSARSYLTRVLTQLVRLPIPSWEELEACRTYGSDFERLESKQMFRVPFLMRTQERNVKTSTVALEAAADAAAADMSQPMTQADGSEQATMATDPWGLERWSHDVYELGCDIGSDVAKLRHIKLMRQAAVYWQTYDAFARVSMSIGVNQLMLAISYYILGYACIEVRAPTAGFGGVLILMGGALILAYIDLTLPPGQRRLIFALLLIGPIISCLAAWNAARGTDLSKRVAECLAPVAFFAHGIVIALLALVLRVREQENGAMLPLAFQGVLYLDVFGWVSHKSAVEEGPTRSRSRVGYPLSRAATGPQSLADEQRAQAANQTTPTSRPQALQRQVVADTEPSSYYAAGYEDVDPKGADPEGETGELAPKPALASISYDEVGRPIPTRPEEMARKGSVHDLRFMPGAPRQFDEVNAVAPASKSFWNPVTFMPPESRQRRQMDELLEGGSEGTGPSEGDIADMDEPDEPGTGGEVEDPHDDNIITGHDHESPGHLPWEIFKLAALVSSLAWIIAGGYFTLVVNDIVNLSKALPFVKSEFPHVPDLHGHHPHLDLPGLLQAERAVPEHGMLSLWASALTGQQLGPPAEPVDVMWPYPTVSPKSLSCDSSGQRLLVSDGLSLYMAELSTAGTAAVVPASQQTGLRQHGNGEATASKQLARFHALPRCQALSGKMVQDTAVVCNHTEDGSSQQCHALALLHGRGAGLAGCSLIEAMDAPSMKRAAAISKAWLQSGRKPRDAMASEAETAMWLMVDPKCRPKEGPGGGCSSVWTTHGRIARLRKRASGAPELVPSSIYELAGEERPPKISGSDTKDHRVVRAFNSRFLGVLHPDLQSIHVFDAGTDGESHSAAKRGSVWLPMQDPVASFCAGGGFLYLLGKGPGPAVWRVPLPSASLSSEL